MLTITVPFARSSLQMHTKENSNSKLKKSVRHLITLIGILWLFTCSKQHAQITQLIQAARVSPAPSHQPALCLLHGRDPMQGGDGWHNLALPPCVLGKAGQQLAGTFKYPHRANRALEQGEGHGTASQAHTMWPQREDKALPEPQQVGRDGVVIHAAFPPHLYSQLQVRKLFSKS